jgi:hypothetical protein
MRKTANLSLPCAIITLEFSTNWGSHNDIQGFSKTFDLKSYIIPFRLW